MPKTCYDPNCKMCEPRRQRDAEAIKNAAKEPTPPEQTQKEQKEQQ